MRTVYAHACDIIREHLPTGCAEPECIAHLLLDAGLLAPDLPEPNFQGAWHTDSTSIRLDSNVTSRVALNLWFGEGNASIRLTTEEAREVAHALLSAANETEKRG